MPALLQGGAGAARWAWSCGAVLSEQQAAAHGVSWGSVPAALQSCGRTPKGASSTAQGERMGSWRETAPGSSVLLGDR